MSHQVPPAGTLVIGPLSTIEEVDAAACALLGYSKQELVGLHGAELVPRDRRPAVAVSLDRIRRGDLAGAVPGVVLRKDGSVVNVEVTARKLPNNRLALSLRPKATAS